MITNILIYVKFDSQIKIEINNYNFDKIKIPAITACIESMTLLQYVPYIMSLKEVLITFKIFVGYA